MFDDDSWFGIKILAKNPLKTKKMRKIIVTAGRQPSILQQMIELPSLVSSSFEVQSSWNFSGTFVNIWGYLCQVWWFLKVCRWSKSPFDLAGCSCRSKPVLLVFSSSWPACIFFFGGPIDLEFCGNTLWYMKIISSKFCAFEGLEVGQTSSATWLFQLWTLCWLHSFNLIWWTLVNPYLPHPNSD